MSTIKISQLPLAAALNSNTGNTIFAGVDLQVGTTYGYSATVLANKLYSNNVLNVGQSAVTLPNTIAQFSLAGESYVQTNFINTNGGGSADHVITANNGTDSTYFLDLGLANPAYQPGLEFNNIGTAVRPLDGYLYVQGGTTSGLLGGNLIVGTTTTGTQIRFIVGGGTSSNVVANMTSTGLVMSGTAGITTSNITATGNVITSTITTTKGTNNNLLIDPDGTGDVYFPTSTEVFVQSTNDSTGTGSGALQVTGGVTVGANLYAANIYTTGSVTATGSITANNITGQSLSMNGSIIMLNSNGNTALSLSRTGFIQINAPTIPAGSNGALSIIGTANGTSQPLLNPGGMLHITGNDNTTTRVSIDSFGTGTTSQINLRSGRGQANVPSPLLSGNVIGRYAATGWISATQAFGSAGVLSPNAIEFAAVDNFSDGVQGSVINFYTAPIGGNTKTLSASIYAANTTFASNVVIVGNETVNGNANVVNTLTANSIIANTATVGGNTVATFVTGTWTPNVIISGATIAYTSANGSYTKIGRQVTAYFTLIGTQNGTSATVSLGNLPFASNTGTGSQGVLTMGGPQAMPGTFGLISGNVVSNSTSSALYCLTQSGPNFGQAAVTGTILGSPFTLNGMVTYISST